MTKKTTLLILSDEYPPFLGGIARYAGEIAAGLSLREFDVHVLRNRRGTSDRSIQMANQEERVTIHDYDRPTSRIASKVFLLLELPRITRKLIQRLEVDHLLIVDPINALPIPLTNRASRVTHHVVLHGSEIRRYAARWLTRTLLKKTLASATTVFTTTEFVDDELEEHFKKRGVRTSCGVGREFLEQDRDDDLVDSLRKRYGLDETLLVAGTICRLDYRKGHDLVLRAMAGLATDYPQLRYIIGGSGEERDRIAELADEWGIGDQVIFAGRIPEDELIAHYDLLDMFVMPNRLTSGTVEGFGISFVEAAARGVPSIGVDNGGVREAIADGVSGTLLMDATAENVQAAMKDVLVGNVGFDQASVRQHAQQFGWDVVVERIARAIQTHR